MALKKQPSDCPGWNGPYFEKKIPKDPWKRDYIYKYPGNKSVFDLYSLGADGKPGGEREDADIFNSDEGEN